MEPLDNLQEMLVETRRTTPAEIAGFRVDFGEWLQSLTPRDRKLAKQLARGEQTGLKQMRQLLFAVGALLALACCVAGLAIRPCVQWMFGDPFLPAVPVLQWMLPGVLLYGLTAIVSQYHAARGMPAVLIALRSSSAT